MQTLARSLGLSVLLAACGSSTGGPSGPCNADFATDSISGTILFQRLANGLNAGAGTSQTASALFTQNGAAFPFFSKPWTCPTACAFAAGPDAGVDAGYGTLESAGTVTFVDVTTGTSTSAAPMSLGPIANFYPDTTFAYGGSDTLQASAPGASAPGFSVQVQAPPFFANVSPNLAQTGLTASLSQQFGVSWSGGSAALVQLTLSDHTNKTIVCQTADSAGDLIIPAGLMAQLDLGTFNITLQRQNFGTPAGGVIATATETVAGSGIVGP